MCGFICIFVDKWELVGIFSCTWWLPGFYFKAGSNSKYCLQCRNYWGGIRGVMHLLVLELHLCCGLLFLSKRKVSFAEGFQRNPLAFLFFLFNSFSSFKRTAKGLRDSLREALTKKLSKNHGRFKSFHVTLQRRLLALCSSLLLDRFAIRFSSQ